MDWPIGLIIVLHVLTEILLIFLAALSTAAETSVFGVKGSRLDKLTEAGDRRAAKLEKLNDPSSRMPLTFTVAKNAFGFIEAALLALLLVLIPVHRILVTVIVIFAAITVVILDIIFGDVIPRRLADTDENCEKFAVALCGFASVLRVVFYPLVALITLVSGAFSRLFGLDPNADDSVMSEEEIRMIADVSSESGEIDETENEMIQNVFEFDDITVGDIATHRTELSILWEEDPDSEWEKTVRDTTHSYYPVCNGDVDHVTGILEARKYLRLQSRDRASVLKSAVVRPRFVAQVMKADVLFKEMKRDHTSFAVVVDEYGGTYGLVTMRDLIEQIVGEIEEGDDGEITKRGAGYVISGLADIEKLDELFDVEIESESTTVGGWVMEHLEKIPEVSDVFTDNNISVRVTKATDKRVLEIYAEKLPDPVPAE